MTYRTAADRPLPLRGHGSFAPYVQRGFDARAAVRLRALGIPADVAVAFDGTPAYGHLVWLAQTFSVPGLRALAERRVDPHDLRVLRVLAEENLSTLRGYVSKTTLRVREVDVLMRQMKIPCQSVLAWTRRLPAEHADANIVTPLSAAQILHRVPVEDLAGWVRYANDHAVTYRGSATYPFSFLGGHTAMFAAAGYTPVEADRLTREGPVDVAALSMLAALRGATR